MDAHNIGLVPGLAAPASGNSLVCPPLGADPRAAALESATPADGPALLRNKDQENRQPDFATMQAVPASCTCLRCVGDLLRQIGNRQ